MSYILKFNTDSTFPISLLLLFVDCRLDKRPELFTTMKQVGWLSSSLLTNKTQVSTNIYFLCVCAEDEGEINFDVDEIITDIEQLDPGWWRGTRQSDGSSGLFPANYVELI